MTRTVQFAALVAALILPAHIPAPRAAHRVAEPIKFARYANIANDGRIAFTYQDDIWVADANGGNPQRLTVNIARDIGPRFSPDGKWIAFTSNRNGNNDVYIIPSTGGEPKQLTWYSGDDQALGWTPDGKEIIISSNRGPRSRSVRRSIACRSTDRHRCRWGWRPRVRCTMNPDATMVAYNRTLPSAWRKGFKAEMPPPTSPWKM